MMADNEVIADQVEIGLHSFGDINNVWKVEENDEARSEATFRFKVERVSKIPCYQSRASSGTYRGRS
jgi:hypothetical protein